MKIISYNIKCDDTIADIKPEFQWEKRKKELAEQIDKFDADIIGMQEVMPHQQDYFMKKLGCKYNAVYQSRDDNATNGEGCPVFYNKSKFNLLRSETFWLSETPQIPASTSWNSRWPRICTYLILEDKKSNKKFAIFNTHLDHKSEDARINGIKLIISKIKEMGLPTILTGDFNASRDTEPVEICKKELTYVNINNDNEITFHLWGQPEILLEGKRYIDYIFVKDMKVKSYKVLNDIKDATKISDHYALQSEIEFI